MNEGANDNLDIDWEASYEDVVQRLHKLEEAAQPLAKLVGVLLGYDDEQPLRQATLPFTWPLIGDVRHLAALLAAFQENDR